MNKNWIAAYAKEITMQKPLSPAGVAQRKILNLVSARPRPALIIAQNGLVEKPGDLRALGT